MKKIGILGFQGAIVEHEKHIIQSGNTPVIVKYPEQLDKIDAIILPGGESTTMGKILNRTGLMNPLKEKILYGLPVWGTCAGMILLAKDIENDSVRHLQVMDITVRRNAYGSQIDSFSTFKSLPEISNKDINLVFIRAPFITKISEKVEVICKVEDNIVAARQNNIFVTSFHPELTNDLSFLNYFIKMIA